MVVVVVWWIAVDLGALIGVVGNVDWFSGSKGQTTARGKQATFIVAVLIGDRFEGWAAGSL